ncbi:MULTISPECIES: hypothetical protein [Pseudomonas]|uniref:Uncharacterized protein n=2 Tax=Pseudomonas TaxID=286 RepID=A0A0B1ZAK9_9PSED|nr:MULTISPECIES: hypothetical protein [Pseudomonas]KHK66442.1 hypothetical protein JZ00_01000 [Pseudomonas frederiksbergensis]KPY29450.1 Uncharacterized protein ALO65_02245 [Pseudomonas syringae pv. papulans]KWS42653.1 hypothetical protein AL059_18245 [Pseudomonas syringae pv. papulans]MDH4601314.1 hypothetical protein [Pseudomonas syringae pv. papulans]MDH4622971.1 hypothetical protein [Pseudomonas syringae pv. papulans]
MRDKVHPFPFDAQAELVMKAFMQATGEKLNRAQRQVGGGDDVQRFSHGGSWQSHHSYDPDRVDQMQTIEHETRLRFEEIMEGRLDVIERTVDEISNSMADSYAKAFYRMLSDTCEEHGNVIDGSAGTLGEQMLKAIETVEYSVDRDGQVSLPEFRMHPSLAKRLHSDPSLHEPQLLARVEEVKKIKITQALAAEAARKAKFRTREQ